MQEEGQAGVVGEEPARGCRGSKAPTGTPWHRRRNATATPPARGAGQGREGRAVLKQHTAPVPADSLKKNHTPRKWPDKWPWFDFRLDGNEIRRLQACLEGGWAARPAAVARQAAPTSAAAGPRRRPFSHGGRRGRPAPSTPSPPEPRQGRGTKKSAGHSPGDEGGQVGPSPPPLVAQRRLVCLWPTPTALLAQFAVW